MGTRMTVRVALGSAVMHRRSGVPLLMCQAANWLYPDAGGAVSELATEEKQARIGNIADVLLWVGSMALWTIVIALRARGKLTIDQFTILNCVVILITAFGVLRLNKAQPGNSSLSQEAHERRARRRRLCIVMILLAAVGGGYKAVLDLTAENRVTKVCLALTPGMSVSNVDTIAEAHGMYTPRDGATIYYMGEKATANQYGCLLRFNGRTLASSSYQSE
jgi:hypothetical protein